MINLDAIEAAAKAANGRMHVPYKAKEVNVWGVGLDFIATANPAAVLEMVSMIRERDVVLRQALETLQDNREEIAGIERMQYMRDYYDPTIEAIKKVLNQ